MSTRSVKAMLSTMKLTDEAVGVVVANNGQGIITIDNFAQLNKKYVKGLFPVLQRSRGTTGGRGGVQSWGCSVSNDRSEPKRYDILYQTFQKIGHMHVCRC